MKHQRLDNADSNSPAQRGVGLEHYVESEHPINLAIAAIGIQFRDGVPVSTCPPGVAEGALFLRNRGREIYVEITAWPRRENGHKLTTGGHEPARLRWAQYEKWLNVVVDARIKYADKMAVTESLMAEVLGISGLELQQMMDRWYEQAFQMGERRKTYGSAKNHREEIEALIRSGKKMSDIADDFKVHKGTIYGINRAMKHQRVEAING